MRKHWLVALLLYLNLCLLFIPVGATPQRKDVVLFFHAKWCGPCRVMETSTWPDKAVTKALADRPARLSKLDFDDKKKNGEHIKFYGVEALPTTILVDRHGNEIRRSVGYLTPEGVVELLKK